MGQKQLRLTSIKHVKRGSLSQEKTATKRYLFHHFLFKSSPVMIFYELTDADCVVQLLKKIFKHKTL